MAIKKLVSHASQNIGVVWRQFDEVAVVIARWTDAWPITAAFSDVSIAESSLKSLSSCPFGRSAALTAIVSPPSRNS